MKKCLSIVMKSMRAVMYASVDRIDMPTPMTRIQGAKKGSENTTPERERNKPRMKDSRTSCSWILIVSQVSVRSGRHQMEDVSEQPKLVEQLLNRPM